ncbi:10800_t:CDS:2 [Paraglomus brasilianum]|uniref:10800_t:CDS:1 n=1 Tax=Paraglomus brasilianum TaxID=144538 RepID=A0A9N9F9D4_9GLOM|nr:10800_t:CDS:2 [Paraglomus brasilianum]
MSRGGGSRDYEDRPEMSRNGRGGYHNGFYHEGGQSRDSYSRDANGSGSGGVKPRRGLSQRSREGGRRRERKTKEATNTLTTPPPDNLSRNFYQSPVILGRTPTGPSSRPETQREEVPRTIATKPSEPKPSLKTKPLERPFAKMIDEKGTINQEIVGRLLSDLPGHFVVGVCGPQGAGKSTILSKFCQDQSNGFTQQSNETLYAANHATIGVDIHVTPERIVLLDTQPIFSLSVLERAMRNDYVPDGMLPELWLELQSLQLVIFLLSVCNVVLVVTEGMDYMTWNFLKKAEMCKYRIPEFPTMPHLNSADDIEYYPEIVLVCNKTPTQEFTTPRYDALCEIVCDMFDTTKLNLFNTVSLNKTFAISPPSLESSPNLFLLPYEPHPLRHKSENMTWTKLNAPDSFISFAESLRNQVFGLPKREGKKGQVSEKDWFRSAVRAWELVRKSEFISEYTRLAQRLKDM